MNERQRYAITHPLTNPDTEDVADYREVDTQSDGNLLLSVLAVDR
jgi:hypothetical protein